MIEGRIIHAGLSHPGRVRKKNQDRWLAEPEEGLFILSDGMGGRNAGEIASSIVVEALPALLAQRLTGVEDLTSPAASEASARTLVDLSRQVLEESRHKPGLTGMGATVVMTLIRNGHFLIGHLGDSRAYLFRNDELRRLTRDHSVVQILLDMGELTSAQAAEHPSRGQITRAVGMEGEAVPDILVEPIEDGDRLLLCCDGLTDMLSDETITALLQNYPEPEKACQRLVNAANAAGGKDNITVVLLEWRKS